MLCTQFRTLTLAAAICISSTSINAETIGLSKATEPDPYQQVLWRSVETAAAKSKSSLTSSVGKGDASLQATQIDAFYAAGVDGVIATLPSPKAAANLAANARKAGKALVFINTTPPQETLGQGVAFVGSDDVEAGKLQMTEVCRVMHGRGTVAILMGELTHSAAKGRTSAEHLVLASPTCSSIELLEEQSASWSRPQAREIVRGWLRAGLRPDAIVANNDEMALGAIDALKDASIKGTVVAGVDATDDALAAMQAGDLTVTVLQDARQQGETALAVARAMIAGESVPPATMVPFKLITSDQATRLARDRSGG